jgi:nicotinate-nucleotide adenylyltransferase
MAEVSVTGLYGGAFDPPHVGHVEVARAAKEHFGLPRLTVLVAEEPGHKETHLRADVRLDLARAAFPDEDVRLDPHPRTIDLLRDERYEAPLFIVGADQFCGFLSWKEPDEVLELAELGVATRPGYPAGPIDAVLEELDQPERVHFFGIEPKPVSSREIRELASAGAPLTGLVPDPVGDLIRARGLYVREAGLH